MPTCLLCNLPTCPQLDNMSTCQPCINLSTCSPVGNMTTCQHDHLFSMQHAHLSTLYQHDHLFSSWQHVHLSTMYQLAHLSSSWHMTTCPPLVNMTTYILCNMSTDQPCINLSTMWQHDHLSSTWQLAHLSSIYKLSRNVLRYEVDPSVGPLLCLYTNHVNFQHRRKYQLILEMTILHHNSQGQRLSEHWLTMLWNNAVFIAHYLGMM